MSNHSKVAPLTTDPRPTAAQSAIVDSYQPPDVTEQLQAKPEETPPDDSLAPAPATQQIPKTASAQKAERASSATNIHWSEALQTTLDHPPAALPRYMILIGFILYIEYEYAFNQFIITY